MKNNKSTGLGLGIIIFLIFLTLKLGQFGEVANWSWWWVTSPLWLPFVIAIIILGTMALLYFLFKR